jgi:tetratricopeptide (TPR) repeat protein
MFYIYARYILIAVFLVLGIVLYSQLGMSAAWYLFAASGLLLLSHLFFGNVWLAFNFLKTGAPEKAARVLSHTWAPNLLVSSNKAYYFFTKGMIALQRKDMPTALSLIEQASKIGLKHNNDNALAHLNLAHIHFVQKDKDKARQYLASAMQFKPTDLMIKDNLQKLEQALK